MAPGSRTSAKIMATSRPPISMTASALNVLIAAEQARLRDTADIGDLLAAKIMRAAVFAVARSRRSLGLRGCRRCRKVTLKRFLFVLIERAPITPPLWLTVQAQT